MAEILAVDHVQLAMPAGQEALARAFYVGVLGLTEERKPANLAARGGVWFRGGAARLHVGVDADFRAARKAHPAFLVRGLEGIDRFYVFDPFGNRIELLEEIRNA
jgi:catechol 2,3-dioxygenase-like lactoylglutathione lyase family enzyme